MCAQVFFVIVKLGYEQLYNFFFYIYIYIYKKVVDERVARVSAWQPLRLSGGAYEVTWWSNTVFCTMFDLFWR
jgi:hypothetical protein